MSNQKNYDFVDVMKFLCSILVIVLHTNPIPRYQSVILPITHCAVPFFFISGAFFLWRKILQTDDTLERNKIIRGYVYHILSIYIFVLIVTIPVTLKSKGYMKNGIAMAVLRFIRDFLFHSTWRSSWFLMASIIGTILTYWFLDKRKLDERIWLSICVLFYIICCTASAYSSVLHSNVVVWKIFSIYVKAFTVPYTSFPVSFLWIFIGKKFAERSISFSCGAKYSKDRLWLWLFIIAMLGLFIESQIVYRFGLTYLTEDCYFMLIPVSILLFNICINVTWNFRYAKLCRTISTISYCVQGSVVEMINHRGGGGRVATIFVDYNHLLDYFRNIYFSEKSN